ncbi:hypothetical protein KP803_14665 [Vibrio sp. ZSDE26]|uniref:Lipoprotein n=1 Tax=Vibrio amylolyticus TaxID=2847292 RepID=A0A9X1XP24_9VIBR|nr:hypothetical protein [Vibrio amylolyticus]MCK6264520.1 hypothetical protein [Vibrio amylolyticus]
MKKLLISLLAMLSISAVACDADGIIHVPTVDADAFLLALNSAPIVDVYDYSFDDLKLASTTDYSASWFNDLGEFCHYHGTLEACHPMPKRLK